MAISKTLQIDVEQRSALGTGASRRMRREGRIPAVLYGHGMAPASLTFTNEAAQAVVHHPGMMELRIAGAGSASAIVKEVQRNAISGLVVHLDLLVVKADEKIQTTVGVQPHGEPVGAAHGGQLEQALHELEIECLPGDLPEFIEVDVSGLAVDQAMHVRDLVLPEGITALSDEALPVFQVRLPRVVEADDEEDEVLVALDEAAPAEDA